jgi:7-carboxy-7-deazaguanine synthase
VYTGKIGKDVDMKLAESFISINGEGVRAGELALFLRFTGCNLSCSYCDTRWANEAGCRYEEKSVEELVGYVSSSGIKNVTLTGGEPMLQRELPDLVEGLLGLQGTRVEIETNRAVPIDKVARLRSIEGTSGRLSFTMDYKLPSSGCEADMITDNFRLLRQEDTVKFVSGSRDDLERAADIISEYDLTKRCHVYISPVFGKIDPQVIVDFMKEKKMNDVRLQLQLHKLIWEPDRRGV